MSDLISREAAETLFRNARKALMEQSRKEHIKDFNTRDLMLLNAEQFIHLLPSVEPERKIGKWIEYERVEETDQGYLVSNYVCDQCHAWVMNQSNYCPNCGAKMEVET